MGRTFRGLAPLLLLALVGAVLAVPLLPMEVSGTVTLDGKPAPAGTVIAAAIGERTCGSFTLAEAGTFGGAGLFDTRLVVAGEEGDADKTIVFSVDGKKAEETAVYTPGAALALDLTVKSGSSSRPSGGGGGGHTPAPPVQPSAPVMEYTGHAFLDLETDGAARFRTVVSTAEKNASLVVDEGVRALDRFGRPLERVTVRGVAPDDLPAAADGAALFGRGLRCEPAGATFDPAVEVRITLTPAEWERLAAGEAFVVRWYDGQAGGWVALETTVHASTRTLTAKVSHFTLFAVFAEAAPTPTVTAAALDAAVTGAETLPPAPGAAVPAPEKEEPPGWLPGADAFALVTAVCIIFVALRRLLK
ncbi:hypothetical protein E2N92_12185 [Methanofollis formosanus]|uniref:Uncharacterized protein n=1 Tax=Methanofollis formosanus TaxID=299308 RepID=A0A8G1EHE3_9EURY|nr:hypothetical protein [Methanofollis formosanus]QYZ80131.1 hypothetical protein E2N92_12185 [Methanofollis formosanus]